MIDPHAAHGVVHDGGDSAGVELVGAGERCVVEECLVRRRIGSAEPGCFVVPSQGGPHSRRRVDRFALTHTSPNVLGAHFIVEPLREVLDRVKLAQ